MMERKTLSPILTYRMGAPDIMVNEIKHMLREAYEDVPNAKSKIKKWKDLISFKTYASLHPMLPPAIIPLNVASKILMGLLEKRTEGDLTKSFLVGVLNEADKRKDLSIVLKEKLNLSEEGLEQFSKAIGYTQMN